MDLSTLSHWQQLAFCSALCERSMPNYQLFCEIEDINEQHLQAQKILNKVWEYLRGQLKSLKNIENQLDALNDLIPDPEQYEHFGAYPAMDTLITLQSCVQAILDNSIEDAQTIQTLTHQRLLEVMEMQEQSKQESQLWLRQQAFEHEVVHLLDNNKSHAEQIKALIPLSKDGGVSQLGVCLQD